MSTNLQNHRTVDGHQFRIIADDLPGQYPYAIFVNGEVVQLDAQLRCEYNPGYSLIAASQEQTRFVNVYRAGDGGICFAKQSYTSNDERLRLRDTGRALFGLKVSFDETTGRVTAERV